LIVSPQFTPSSQYLWIRHWRGLTQLSQLTTHVGRLAGPIAASAFNRLGQYASSPGNRAYCYAKLAVFSLAVAETVASTITPTHGGMARLSRPGWLG